MTTLTPIENRDGRWYKREDLLRDLTGVNGAKYRQCGFLVERAAAAGAVRLVTGASVLSPQHAMTALEAARLGLPLTCVLGGTSPETAIRNPSVRIAVENGARLDTAVRVGYNPQIQRRVQQLALRPGTIAIGYGISIPDGAPLEDIRAFHAVGAAQVANLPEGLDNLIVPLGSGNSCTSLLYGLATHPAPPTRVTIIGIGPSRFQWMLTRLARLGATPTMALAHYDLHATKTYSYTDKVKKTSDGILLHPTYEAKVVTWIEAHPEVAPGWENRDNSTALWIVGGPL